MTTMIVLLMLSGTHIHRSEETGGLFQVDMRTTETAQFIAVVPIDELAIDFEKATDVVMALGAVDKLASMSRGDLLHDVDEGSLERTEFL